MTDSVTRHPKGGWVGSILFHKVTHHFMSVYLQCMFHFIACFGAGTSAGFCQERLPYSAGEANGGESESYMSLICSHLQFVHETNFSWCLFTLILFLLVSIVQES